MMSEEPNTNARETYAPPHKVLTNHDLLTEIFIRLPILSIHLFTCVSKQWLKILKSLAFTLKRSQIRSLDSPVGLFVNHIRSSFDCDFVSLDPRINSRKYTIENSFTLGSTKEADKVTILQSCNGLLLCTSSRRHAFDYVYNPSTNLLKILPESDYANVDSNVYGCAGLRLAFDPTKSPYYKVPAYALQAKYRIPRHPIITIIQVPQSLQQGRNFFKSYGNILPMIITIQIPHILHLEGKLFDSRWCLLLVRQDDFGSSKFTIYEMMKGSSIWSVRYHVDTDDFMNPLLEGWSIRSTVWSIILGEREVDSFLVINLSGKVVEYNLMSKNLRVMYDMGSNQLTNDYHDGFIPPFAMYDMRPKQVDHKSVMRRRGRKKYLAIKKFEEMKFLMIDTSNLPPHKRAFIERQQAEIMKKYEDAGADDAGADD
ncbi:receptor-like serine/threonine-protein kinase SD1-8 [Tanacetum coccineum]